eukprot:TRINITY_DN4684_c3_g1_i1.p1 TRINITY_DN4684_c3_g1~~TRINITY_DN4684_c3_g1_i1.p1  ORF type:complete len:292 (+),score=74.62 TRINITY_DN4684_c3_g1_i1:80-877(+)
MLCGPRVVAAAQAHRDVGGEDSLLDAETALIGAARCGDAEAALASLRRGADPEAKDSYGRTALYLAVWWGRCEVWGALLAHGACSGVQARTSPKYTPLHAAAFQGDLRAARALLATGSNTGIFTRDACGRTPQELSEFRTRADPFGTHRHQQVLELLRTVAEAKPRAVAFLLATSRAISIGAKVRVRLRIPRRRVTLGEVLSAASVPGYWWVRVDQGSSELVAPRDILSHQLLPRDVQRVVVGFLVDGFMGPESHSRATLLPSAP